MLLLSLVRLNHSGVAGNCCQILESIVSLSHMSLEKGLQLLVELWQADIVPQAQCSVPEHGSLPPLPLPQLEVLSPSGLSPQRL